MRFLREWGWILPLILLPISAFFFASGLEIEADNLKYMGIAWGMQETGNYIVPFANGTMYTDKPPLLFWMILVFWHVFGVNAVGLQCLVCFLLGVWIWLTRATYVMIFPEDKSGKVLLPYLMVSSFAILDYAHFLHVDLFLVTGVLLTNLGICQRLRTPSFIANLFIVLGIFIGLFAKGPVIYVFTLLPFFVSLLFKQDYRAHFFKIMSLMMMGTMLFLLAWVVPVVLMTDQAFFQQIAYKQIANRATFIEDKSWLFYVIKLPYLLLPWSLSILYIRKMSVAVKEVWKSNLFILMVIVLGILVLSFFGQKRFWYLLPCVPYSMIVLTRFFSAKKEIFIRWFTVLGLIIALLYTVISPYYFLCTESAMKLGAIKQIFMEQKMRGEGVALWLGDGPVYRFNYLAKMSVIPVLNNDDEMQQWLASHPRGIVIMHATQCPSSLQWVIPSEALNYVLCQKA